MKTTRSAIALFFLGVILCPFSHAEYLSLQDIHVTEVLAAPPKADSAEQKADLLEVQSWQKRRTPEECARAEHVAHVTLASGFKSPDGPLSESEVKRLSPFFDEIKEAAEIFIKDGKNYWRRPRPFVSTKSILPCTARDKAEPSFSYPSGHSTLAWVFARVLAEVNPERKKQFFGRAKQIAQDRVLAGVHYPTDIVAGEKMGEIVFQHLMLSPEFKKDLKTAALGWPR
jgi:acid phosphatase (class A)